MENPNAFKNMINEAVVKKISAAIQNVYPAFPSADFLKVRLKLKELELKARVLVITQHLERTLPKDYEKSVKILLKAMNKSDLKGFELWPFSEFISQFGLNHFDESFEVMYILTQKFTAEWAVRPFFIQDHKKVLKYFLKRAQDENVHIRRWVSEGSRPLLPWGQKLPLFIENPAHTIPLLDALKFDEELYVRKSVANHLNDISKHHPDVVIETLKSWHKNVPDIHIEKLQWITRHALRTLIKKGYPAAMKLMGIDGKASVEVHKLQLNKKSYKLNDTLQFSFFLKSTSKSSQKLIIDYAIDFMKANGKKGRKVFKLKTLILPGNEELLITKKHSLKPITTMKYYTGEHHLSLQVNGHIVNEMSFMFRN